jgi:hypothetical protein
VRFHFLKKKFFKLGIHTSSAEIKKKKERKKRKIRHNRSVPLFVGKYRKLGLKKGNMVPKSCFKITMEGYYK